MISDVLNFSVKSTFIQVKFKHEVGIPFNSLNDGWVSRKPDGRVPHVTVAGSMGEALTG